MNYYAKWLLVVVTVLVAISTTDAVADANFSLCGEQVTRHSGFLNDIFYVLFDSTSNSSAQDIPLVLWLSGGPGCSGLVGALFELGPCTFDDESNRMLLNEFSWTAHAHVIFVDQPRGTGFSRPNKDTSSWTENGAMKDMAGFVDAFFDQNPSLSENDFYIFGESFGGHYAPDLGATLLRRDPSWRFRLKGVGIGNGVVSPIANLQTYLDFVKENKYASDIVSGREAELVAKQQLAIRLSLRCRAERALRDSTGSQPKRMRALALEEEAASEQYPQVCTAAANAASAFESAVVSSTLTSGHNIYDLRRPCHLEDRLGMCYYFSRFEDYLNDHALAYFGVPNRKWSLCSTSVMATLPHVEFLEESEGNVAFLLENDVRVLVYAGDADTMAPWNMQDRWTHDLVWSEQNTFNWSPLNELTLNGQQVGMVRTAKGLTLVRVFESGHMVPRDQPKVSLELLRGFSQAKGSAFGFL